MKQVYTCPDTLRLGNARNLLEQAGIDTEMRNEYASSGVGELGFTDAWPSLWVINDGDYSRACKLVKTAFTDEPGADWLCQQCGESNPSGFELCWHCETAAPQSD